jgi:hypothetical protein
MKEPENIDFGRNKQQTQQFSNDNNNNINNNNNQIESKNFYEGKRDEIKKTEISNVESGNVENPDRGAGIYYVSFGKTTESFNFGSGRETHIRDDDEDMVIKKNIRFFCNFSKPISLSLFDFILLYFGCL